MIIAFLGNIASGKTISANYCADLLNGKVLSFSTGIKTMCDRIGLAHTRHNLVNIGNVMRDMVGTKIWINLLKDDIMDAQKNKVTVIIDDVRFLDEYTYLQEQEEVILIYLFSPTDSLLERVKLRSKNGDDEYGNLSDFERYLRICKSEKFNYHLRSSRVEGLTTYDNHSFLKPHYMYNMGTKQQLFGQLDRFLYII